MANRLSFRSFSGAAIAIDLTMSIWLSAFFSWSSAPFEICPAHRSFVF